MVILGEFVAHDLVLVTVLMFGGGPAEWHFVTAFGGSIGSFEKDSARSQFIVADSV